MTKPARAEWKPWLILPIVTLGATALLLASAWRGVGTGQPRAVSYSELAAEVDKGDVDQAEIAPDAITARVKGTPPRWIVAQRLPGLPETTLVDALQKHGATISGHTDHGGGGFWIPLLVGALPFLGLPLLLFFAFGASKQARPMSFGGQKAKLYDRSKENPVTFEDVAGVEEAKAELTEVVRFLKDAKDYAAMGARVPKGVLLVGPPGTGKTLLAKAVAGEAGVPFFSMSGSEFVEMFVGVGASRVRELFVQAKERAPCIVFIDELDAIGKSRAGAMSVMTNDEREQTLNQLLVEMDGFETNNGLIIMAATNRPEVLDRALLRPGRFDRAVLVDRPDVKGREAILRVHARKVKLGASVDLDVIARRTPGMVGADLANVVNEAALAAVRRGSVSVDAEDFEEAIDRMQLGLKKEGRAMNEAEKRRVAFHESGHTLVALSVEHADPVHRVTIIPRSIGALGATLQLPIDERHLMTREELRDRVCVLLGGRVAEELACEDISTGAENDLERATDIARQMVCRYGMSERLGPITYAKAGPRFLQAPELGLGEERACSEETSRAIDAEIASVVSGQLERARRVLRQRRATLDAVAGALLQKETLERAELEAIVAATPAAPPDIPLALASGHDVSPPPSKRTMTIVR